MKDAAVIFGDKTFMRSSSVRQNLVRIPEIYDYLSKAQKTWDSIQGVKSLSFHNVFYRGDEFFESHKEIFDLLTDIVQLGMVHRLENKGIKFKYVLSSLDNTKADLVYLNKIRFEDMILSSPAVKANSTNVQNKIRLIGLTPNKSNQYRIFRKSDCGLKLLEISSDLDLLLESHLESTVIYNLSFGHSVQIEQVLKRRAAAEEEATAATSAATAPVAVAEGEEVLVQGAAAAAAGFSILDFLQSDDQLSLFHDIHESLTL